MKELPTTLRLIKIHFSVINWDKEDDNYSALYHLDRALCAWLEYYSIFWRKDRIDE